MAGAILSVTVHETTIRSACRGPGANGMTPSRMKSWRAMEVGIDSIAQQARPKLNPHREYLRPQFSRYRAGVGAIRCSGPMLGMPNAVAPFEPSPLVQPPRVVKPSWVVEPVETTST